MENKQQNNPQSADQKELDFFDNIADEWWKKDGKFKPLHDFNPPRLKFLEEEIIRHFSLKKNLDKNNNNSILQKIKILDVGCGGGLIAEPLARLGASITAIDLVEKNIIIAKEHAESENLHINYKCIAMEDLDTTEKYDVILHMDLLEHVTNASDFIQASANLLTDEGIYFATTLNRTLKSLALGKIMAEYILRWLAPGTHDWNKFIKPSELQNDLLNAHLKIKNIRGISYSPLSKEWTLSEDLSINYIISAIKL